MSKKNTELGRTALDTDRPRYSILKEIQDEIKDSFENRIIDLDDPSILERNPFNRRMITSTTIIRYRGGLGIRCKVDGVQQSAEPLSATEEQKYNRLLQSGNVDELKKYTVHLAEIYFGSQTEEQQTKGFRR